MSGKGQHQHQGLTTTHGEYYPEVEQAIQQLSSRLDSNASGTEPIRFAGRRAGRRVGAVSSFVLVLLGHDGGNQIVRQDVRPNLFSDQLRGLATKAFHLHQGLDTS